MRIMALMSISGVILLAGLAVSYAGSELATANLETIASSLDAGNILKASVNLDPEKSKQGVYAAKSVGSDHYGLVLSITGPDNELIDTQTIQGDSGEAGFTISAAGTYTLEATNTSEETRDIVIAVGYKSQESALALVAAGSYVIIAGMIAMGVTLAYAIKKSRAS